MKLITYKNNLITYENFLQDARNYNYVDGLIIPIIMTKDKEIVVFDDQVTGTARTEIIQNNTFGELQKSAIIKLENFLKQISSFKKRIIINVYPLYQILLSDETIQYINEQNRNYITLIKEIISKFLQLNISLCSYNQQLLTIMKKIIVGRKKGLIVLQQDLSYLDLDFYIIAPTMLDALIIDEQLNRGKEVMISSFSGNDLATLNNYFIKNSTALKKQIFNKLTFISAYPELFNQLFTK